MDINSVKGQLLAGLFFIQSSAGRRVIRALERKSITALLIVGLIFGFAPLAPRNAEGAPNVVIPVTTNLDTMDAGPICQVIMIPMLPGPDGVISLREAICAANNTPPFNHMIISMIPPMPPIMIGSPPQLLGPLPMITAPMMIQGVPGLVIDGSMAGPGNGLSIGPLVIPGVVQIVFMTIQNFTGNGVEITSGPAIVQTSHIGIDLGGAICTPNGGNGVYISGSPANLIGGATGLGNVISCNLGDGVLIDGGAIAAGNQIYGNIIGADLGGALARPNNLSGIEIDGVPGNMIGGPNPGENNLISYNTLKGIYIHGNDATGNTVINNMIGTDTSGTVDAGNLQEGVVIEDSPSNTIGSSAANSGNLISGNDLDGVLITGEDATLNKVQGNLIGVDTTGLKVLPNTGVGVHVSNAPKNYIGGEDPGEGNVISGNGAEGVLVENSLATDNFICGNFIGVDSGQTLNLGNGMDGIRVSSAMTTTIGGTTTLARNIISFNNNDGVRIVGTTARGNLVKGNSIGTDASGSLALPNSKSGVFINGAPKNIIGGTSIFETNIIAWNTATGIVVKGNTAVKNLLSRNLIFENGGLGIDLENDGVTPNDALDADAGANQLQNFPRIDRARVTATTTEIVGELLSLPSTTFNIQYYSNQTCDPSSYGEGQYYLGSSSVSTNASGFGIIGASLSVTTTVGYSLTAIAIDPLFNTSEFSPCREVAKIALYVPLAMKK